MKVDYTLPIISEADLENKKVLLRADLNLPVDETGEVTDLTRLTSSLPTIEYLLQNHAKVFLISHFGRPKNIQNKTEREKFSLQKVLPKLQSLLPEIKVSFMEDIFDSSAINKLEPGGICILENIRYHKAETSKDEKEREGFAKKVTSAFDIYVNDAFGTCHRSQASVTDFPKFLPHYAGLLLQKELEMYSSILQNIQRPFVAIIGGAKVSTKLNVLRSLIKLVDTILIGGAMAYTFLKSRALQIGSSLFERDYLASAFRIIDDTALAQKKILLPSDHLIVKNVKEGEKTKIVKREIPEGFIGVDIGPNTTKEYIKHVGTAKTIFWNGPMGVFEIDKFSKGTVSIAKAVASSDAKSIVGGGDSVSALKKAGVEEAITHVSTGGGASLELLNGSSLPGITALQSKN